MNVSHVSRATTDSEEQVFAELFEQLVDKLYTGAAVDLDQLLNDHPEHAARLRSLLPTIQAMTSLAAPSDVDEQPTTDPATHRTLGEYRIIRALGHGGMGVVYEAEQPSLGRHVALKVLPFAAVLDQRQLARFKTEAQAAALLQHQNIVPVYSVGCDRGVHYYAMQYVEGQTLAELITELRRQRDDRRSDPDSSNLQAAKDTLPIAGGDADDGTIRQNTPLQQLSSLAHYDSVDFYRSVAQLGIQAAEALDHAHRHAVLHRDIKPANVLLDLNAHLWITDFGLARVGTEIGITQTGDVMGTLRFASPEQALGKRVVTDHRTDIYSLGATLYELLTLQPAHDGQDRQQLLRQIAEKDPLAPRRIDARIPSDLETIVLKAMAKSVDERYETALDLADDLRRYLQDKVILARRPSARQRLMRWSRRHRVALMSIAGTLLIASLISTGLLLNAYSKVVAEQNRATSERSQAHAHLQIAMQAVDDMYTEVASEWIADDVAISQTQQLFLDNAMSVYEYLTSQPYYNEDLKPTVATAYLRMAKIQGSRGQRQAQREATEESIAMFRDLAKQSPDHGDYRDKLVESYHLHSDVLSELGYYDQSLEALDNAREELEVLNERYAEELRPAQQLAANQLHRARVLMAAGRWEQAERCARRARQAYEEFLQQRGQSVDIWLGWLRSSRHLAELLRFQGRAQEGAKLCHEAAYRCHSLRTDAGLDHAGLAIEEVEIQCELAESLSASEKHKDAADHFRKALRLKVQTLKAGVKPILWSLSFPIRDEFRDEEYEQPDAFCDYAMLQLRMIPTLQRLGRWHEAELMLGEATTSCQIQATMYPEEMRFVIAEANAFARLGQLLKDRRPHEAQLARERAAWIWQRVTQQWPRATDYRSGVHGAESDLAWLSRTFPEQSVEGTAGGDEAPGPRDGTVFWHHTRGVMFVEANWHPDALSNLNRSVELRQDSQAFDWLYLAMAHWKNGDVAMARNQYERAVSWIQQHIPADVELKELREQVAAQTKLEPGS